MNNRVDRGDLIKDKIPGVCKSHQVSKQDCAACGTALLHTPCSQGLSVLETSPYLCLAAGHELQEGNGAAADLKRQKQPEPARKLQVLGLSASRLCLCVCLLNIHGPAICGTQTGCVPGESLG